MSLAENNRTEVSEDWIPEKYNLNKVDYKAGTVAGALAGAKSEQFSKWNFESYVLWS